MNNRNRRNPPDVRQQSLAMEYPVDQENAPDLDIENELRGSVAFAIKQAKNKGRGREQIIDRMNLCLPELKKALTVRQLNSWTATSKEYSEFPARFLQAFCWATQCWAPLEVGPAALGFDIIDREDKDALELGRIALAKADLQGRERDLKRR